MEQKRKVEKIALPSITKALGNGFNLIAENIHFIVLPILFDLLVWLGPRFRAYDLLKGNVISLSQQIDQNAPANLLNQMNSLRDIALSALEQTNIMGAIHFFPISVPILLGGNTSMAGPIDNLQVIELHSVFVLFLLVALLALTGLLFGCFYYSAIAKKTSIIAYRLTLHRFFRQLLNSFVAVLLLFISLVILLIPISCILSILLMVSSGLAQFLSMIFMIMIAWLIIPLFFTMHGIFLGNGVIESLKMSFNLARWFSTSTSFFIVAIVVISQGMNLIWTIPQPDSWLLLIGITGHAFITTSLISASFILYQQYLSWISENEELITKGIIQK